VGNRHVQHIAKGRVRTAGWSEEERTDTRLYTALLCDFRGGEGGAATLHKQINVNKAQSRSPPVDKMSCSLWCCHPPALSSTLHGGIYVVSIRGRYSTQGNAQRATGFRTPPRVCIDSPGLFNVLCEMCLGNGRCAPLVSGVLPGSPWPRVK
jgi:hypothetical protein